MRLPAGAIIARDKLTDYLLTHRPMNDKSRFLTLAGYTWNNWHSLEQDLRSQILTHEAQFQETTPYGDLYEIRGTLTGPNGIALRIVTFWMVERATGQTKFITLFPDRGSGKEEKP